MVALLLPWPGHGWLGNPRRGKDLQAWFRKVRYDAEGTNRHGRHGTMWLGVFWNALARQA